MSDLPEHVRRNRAAWDVWARDYAGPGEAAWERSHPTWGIWGVPESELGLLEGLGAGADVVELGCGTASVSSWIARAGFRPVAVDISRKQLDVAAGLQKEVGLSFPLIHASAEDVPYESASCTLLSMRSVNGVVVGPAGSVSLSRRSIGPVSASRSRCR